MKRTVTGAVLASTMLAGAAMAATVNQGTGYAIDSTSSRLVTVTDLRNPGATSSSVQLRENGQLTKVDALAFRPNTGEFFAYRDAGDLVYNVNVATGALTAVASGSGTNMDGQPIATSTRRVGFDFNNALDAARIVSVEEENLVFFPPGSSGPDGTVREGGVIRATDLFYVGVQPATDTMPAMDADPNFGTNPTIFANAYTNAVAQADVNGSTQEQYVLDSRLDVIATLGNNSGELRTIGRILVDGQALDFSPIGGFDILSPASDDNLGLALLNVMGADGMSMSNLYSFALPAAGSMGDVEATFVSTFGSGFRGFAVTFNGEAPEVAPVPLPAAAWLLAGALGGLGAFGRMRRKA